VLTNNGNVALRNLLVGGYDLATVACNEGSPAGAPVANPVPSLPVNGIITCEGIFTFTQPKIELGDATATNTNAHKTKAASTLNKVPPSNTAFTQDITLADVTVPNNPKLQTYIDLNTCTFTGNPAKERECAAPVRTAIPYAIPLASCLIPCLCCMYSIRNDMWRPLFARCCCQ
jgi:hypothetical protein